MEIINFGRQVSPKRVYTLVKLVEKLGVSSRKEILDYLQPDSLVQDQTASKNAFKSAKILELIADTENNDKKITLHPSIDNPSMLDGMDNFREVIQSRMLGVVEDNQDNYLFNLVMAWYAVKDDESVKFSKSELINTFNSEVFPQVENTVLEEGLRFNDTKLNAWLDWAAFLGFGFLYKDKLLPDAHRRIMPVIKRIDGERIPAGEFLEQIAISCPELDGGKLYKYCWEASRAGEQMGGQISLMLSTALRKLKKMKVLDLIYLPDAERTINLHKATGYGDNQISHIKIEAYNAI